MRAALFSAILVLARADGEPGPGENARAVLDAFVAREAAREPAYRTELKAAGPGDEGQGRPRGFSPILRAFTYRPRTYSELPPEERAALLRDPGFRPFIEARLHPLATRAVLLTAGEVLSAEPLSVAVPSP